MKIKWFLPELVLLCLISNILCGQHNLPVTVSVYNESTSMPFTDWWSNPVHPGVQIGTEFHGASDRNLRLYPAITVGYLFHKNLFQGAYARLDLGLDYRHPSGVSLKAKLGAGYLRTFATRTEYVLRDDQLVAQTDKGNHRVMPSLAFGLGYRFRPKDPRSTEIFLMHETWVEYPYAGDFIPVMAHTNLHLGATFYPFNSKNLGK